MVASLAFSHFGEGQAGHLGAQPKARAVRESAVETRTFAELLIDWEEDRTPAVLVGMLREADRIA